MHGGFFGVEVFFVVVRLPDHVAADRRARARPARISPAPVLAAAGPPAAAGARRAPGDRRRRAALIAGTTSSQVTSCGATSRGRSSTSATGARSSATCRTTAATRRCCATCGAWRSRSSGTCSGRSSSSRSAASGCPTAHGRRARRRWRWRRWCSSFGIHAAGPGPIAARSVRRRRPGQLHVPVDVHPLGGLLLGAAAAFVWRPWRGRSTAATSDPAPGSRARRRRGRAAVGVLVVRRRRRRVLTEGYVYQWLLALVSVLSLIGRCSSPSTRRRLGVPRRVFALGAARRGRQAQLRAVPVALADLRVRRGDRGGSGRLVGAVRGHGRAVRALLPVRRDAGAQRHVRRGGGARPRPAARALVPRRSACCVVVVLGRRVLRRRPARSTRRPVGEPPTSRHRRRRRRPAPSPPRRRCRGAGPATAAVADDRSRRRRARRVADRRRLAGPLAGRQPARGHRRHVRRHRRGAARVQRLRRRAASARPARASATTSASCDGGQTSGPTPSRDADAEIALVVLGAWDVFDLDARRRRRAGVRHAGVGRLRRGQLQTGIDALARHRRPRRVARGRRACARRTSRAPACRRCPSVATTPGSPTSTTCSARSPRPTPATTTFVDGSGRVVRRRGDRHRPRLALGRRPRLQAGRQAHLRDDHPTPCSPSDPSMAAAVSVRGRTSGHEP